MAAALPPPLHGAPSEKERKYDRQLRLWAASGQAALENSHVLLINSGTGVVGVEALKNLVLPGIGQFSILDSAQVTEADLGVSFFLEVDDIGKFRAERTCALLNELNPDVQGHVISEPLETFIMSPKALSPYTFILVVLPMQSEIHQKIVAHSTATNTPTFYIHCTGFCAHITSQLPSALPIVDTHPDPTSISDLRLLEPWPELQSHIHRATSGLEQMSDEEHGHVPYVHLLLHYLEVWKSQHGGRAPADYKEKLQFRTLVQQGARTKTAEGGEENFDEATGAVLKSLTPHRVSADVKAIFAAPECTELTGNSSSFWFIASAVSSFYSTHGVLPVSGTIPDMKTTSSSYVELQGLYKSKARADVATVTNNLRKLETQLSISTKVEPSEIEAFCKSVAHMKLIRGRTPHVIRAGEDISWGDRAVSLAADLRNADSLIHIHLAFLAHDTYTLTHQTADGAAKNTSQIPTSNPLPTVTGLPAVEDHSMAGSKIISIAHHHLDSLIKAAGTFVEDPDYTTIRTSLAKLVDEILRADNAEIHNIAAVAGGVAAQEAIKVITGQYVPIDNTWLYDGIRSVMNVLQV